MIIDQYKDKDNTIVVALLQDGVPVDADFISSASVSLTNPDTDVIIKIVSATEGGFGVGNVFDVSASKSVVNPLTGIAATVKVLKIKLGTTVTAIPVKDKYDASLIIFDAAHADGVVIDTFQLNFILELLP